MNNSYRKILKQFLAIVNLKYYIRSIFRCFSKNKEQIFPNICSDNWGKITISHKGKTTTFNHDVVIYPDRVIRWDWRWQKDTQQMHHNPGYRKEDIDHFLLAEKNKPDAVIFTEGRGHGGLRDNLGKRVLQISDKVKQYIKQKYQNVYFCKTAAGVNLYQDLCKKGKKVIFMGHLTC